MTESANLDLHPPAALVIGGAAARVGRGESQ
jgi:hypothetical protein